MEEQVKQHREKTIRQIQNAGPSTSLAWALLWGKKSMSRERGRGCCSVVKETKETSKCKDPDSKRATLEEDWGKLQKCKYELDISY